MRCLTDFWIEGGACSVQRPVVCSDFGWAPHSGISARALKIRQIHRSPLPRSILLGSRQLSAPFLPSYLQSTESTGAHICSQSLSDKEMFAPSSAEPSSNSIEIDSTNDTANDHVSRIHRDE